MNCSGQSFAQNRSWSFQSDAPFIKSFALFLVVHICVATTHYMAVSWLVDTRGLHPILAILISAATIIMPLFVVLERVVFKSRGEQA
mgnify:CR=1 FL=1